jgi:formate dehydrogenase subunit gamma
MTLTAPPGTTTTTATSGSIVRYTLFDRILHWEVAVTFTYLLLSGMALAYPRLAWMMTWLGGGQTVRAAHPWVGIAFTIGIVIMLVMWARPMRFDGTDREWVRRLRQYTRTGHTGVDVGRYNAGQKGYYWFSVVFGVILLLSGIPLWYPWILGAGSGLQKASRIIHHLSYLFMFAGFIIHVYMSTVMLPGTMSAMTSGKVTRRWALWHHPRWVREKEGSAE